MLVRNITQRLSLDLVQTEAMNFAFETARAIFNLALEISQNELPFVPGCLPTKYRFYSDLVCSKTNKPRYEALKDRRIKIAHKWRYLPKGAAQSVIYDAWAVLNSFKENFWSWKQDLQTKKKSMWRAKPRHPRLSVEPRGFTLSAGRGLTVSNDVLTLPKALGTPRPVLPLPMELRNKLGIISIQRVRIYPRWGEIFAAISYKVAKQQIASYSRRRCLAIDPGVNCLAVVNNIANPPMLFKMGHLKSRNLSYRRELNRLKKIYDSQSISDGPARHRLLRKRFGFFRTEFGRLTNKIVNYCVRHGIGRIVVGRNKEWKRNGKLSTKMNTTSFQLLPFELFNHALTCKAELEGIEVVFQQESYTSQASFDDGDTSSRSFCSKNGGFSGKRFQNKPRKYVTARGYVVHADVNAAANILKKYSPDLAKRKAVRIFNPVTVKW